MTTMTEQKTAYHFNDKYALWDVVWALTAEQKGSIDDLTAGVPETGYKMPCGVKVENKSSRDLEDGTHLKHYDLKKGGTFLKVTRVTPQSSSPEDTPADSFVVEVVGNKTDKDILKAIGGLEESGEAKKVSPDITSWSDLQEQLTGKTRVRSAIFTAPVENTAKPDEDKKSASNFYDKVIKTDYKDGQNYAQQHRRFKEWDYDVPAYEDLKSNPDFKQKSPVKIITARGLASAEAVLAVAAAYLSVHAGDTEKEPGKKHFKSGEISSLMYAKANIKPVAAIIALLKAGVLQNEGGESYSYNGMLDGMTPDLYYQAVGSSLMGLSNHQKAQALRKVSPEFAADVKAMMNQAKNPEKEVFDKPVAPYSEDGLIVENFERYSKNAEYQKVITAAFYLNKTDIDLTAANIAGVMTGHKKYDFIAYYIASMKREGFLVNVGMDENKNKIMKLKKIIPSFEKTYNENIMEMAGIADEQKQVFAAQLNPKPIVS